MRYKEIPLEYNTHYDRKIYPFFEKAARILLYKYGIWLTLSLWEEISIFPNDIETHVEAAWTQDTKLIVASKYWSFL